MSIEIWEAVRSSLPEIQTIDFIIGDEIFDRYKLADWINEAKSAGCRTGVQADLVNLTKQFCQQIIEAGIDRITISMLGTTIDSYAAAAKGVDFEKICANIMVMNSLRAGLATTMIVDFLLSLTNIFQIEDMVVLAARLGADKVHFSQCDVIQGVFKKASGFSHSKESAGKRRINKALTSGRWLAKKMNIDFTSFSHTPEEQPVCDQDPRNSLLIRHDGTVAPCINLAVGGAVFFLGRKVDLPAVHYGRLPAQTLVELWENKVCRFYRKRFHDRLRAHDATLGISSFEASWPKLQEILQTAKDAMPPPPKGCDVCPYLYDI